MCVCVCVIVGDKFQCYGYVCVCVRVILEPSSNIMATYVYVSVTLYRCVQAN